MEKKVYNRWIVVLGGVITQFCLGALYTWSVFQKPIQDQMGWEATDVSLAFSINLALIPLLMILTGRLMDKIGPTKMAMAGGVVLALGLLLSSQTDKFDSIITLYLGYGVLGGAGIGMAYGVPIATCVRWFPDKRGMITGLAVSGFGLGSVFWAPIATGLIENMGPFTTFMIQAVYTVIGVSLGASLMRAAPQGYVPEGYTPPTAAAGKGIMTNLELTSREMLRTPNYYYLLVMYAFANVAGLMIIGHASPIGQQVANLSVVEAGSIVSILALVNTVGRLFWGTVSDKIGRTRVVAFMYVISAATMFGMNMLNTFWLYAIGVGLIAFCFGGAMGTFPSITADYFGTKHVSTNYGFVFLAYSIGAIVGPRLASSVVVSTGDYNMAFFITGILCSIGAVMALLSKPPRSRKSE